MNNFNYRFEENFRVIRLISLIRIDIVENRWTDRQTDKQTNKQTNMTDYPIVAEGAYDNVPGVGCNAQLKLRMF